jgi:cation transport regulator ChaC
LHLPNLFHIKEIMITKAINYIRNTNNATLKSFGEKLHVNHQMAVNRDNFVTAPLVAGSADEMKNVLMEMRLLINGKYAGNRDYLFERMDHLIKLGFTAELNSRKKESTITVNKKSMKTLKKSVARRDKMGRFVTKSKASRKK